MNRTFRRADLMLIAAIAVASIASVAGFRAVFADWSFLSSAVVGGVGAAGIVAVSWWKRLLIGESVALSVVALVLLGAVATSGLPTPDAFRVLFDGLTTGWADLLSLSPPADTTAELRVLPFVLAWIGTTVGGELVRRSNAPALPTLGPLISLSVAVLVTAEDRAVGIAQGTIIAVVALLIGFSQFRRSTATHQPAHTVRSDVLDHDVDVDLEGDDHIAVERRRRIRTLRVGVALLLIALVAPFAGPRLPFAEANERFDLRDRNEPPWDPLSIPSPLVQIKAALKDETRDDVVFTVTSDELLTRWTLAVLGDYDGVVWTVGSAQGRDAQAEFRPVGSQLPSPVVEVDQPSERSTATITVGTLRGPWLPSAGRATAIEFDESAEVAESTLDRLRVNIVTGTLAYPPGIGDGFSYTIETDVPIERTDAEIAALPVETAQPIDIDVIPPPIRNLAADVVEGVDNGWPQVLAVQNKFVTEGFYDRSPESRPGHSYFRLAEFLEEPDRLIGFEEQYAAAAATIARIAQIPARVVVGYVIPPSRYGSNGQAEVRADDISAWIEVDFGTAGWIPVDVSPDRSREPVAEETGISVEEVAVPSPPPPPVIPPNLDVFSGEEEAEEDDEDDEADDDQRSESSQNALLLASAIGVGSVFAAGLLLLIGIVLWKRQRRNRRRRLDDPAERIGYAWRETLDRIVETGHDVDDRATPPEVVRTLVASIPASPDDMNHLVSMSAAVQRAAYHADPPDHDDGEQAWNYYDDVSSSLRQQRSVIERFKMAVDPRTLRQRGWPQAPERPHRSNDE